MGAIDIVHCDIGVSITKKRIINDWPVIGMQSVLEL